MEKKKKALGIVAALLVVGIVGIGLSQAQDVGIERTATGGDGSKGVYGKATNTGDVRNYGGFFDAMGGLGRGVYGRASNTGDYINYGGFFYASGEQGRGVLGQSIGSSGYAVKGWASNNGSDVQNYGGHFTAAGGKGIGVYGCAEKGEYPGKNYGGYFVANASSGVGVYGNSSSLNPSEWKVGGLFEAMGPWGTGVEARGMHAGVWAEGNYGVQAWGDEVGVMASGERDYDFYAYGPATNYGPFTGAHEVKLSADFPENVTSGMIVSVTGETQVRQIDGRNISFSSTLPTVQLSNMPEDSKVFGVLIAESPLPEEHWYINESIEGDRFGIVNALGEGRVWVTDINGDIVAGDYITTSLVAGYGQKQDDDVLHSYTLGKAIESVTWSEVTTTVEYNGQTYNAYPIAVVYTSG
jgi:hypothetical protein